MQITDESAEVSALDAVQIEYIDEAELTDTAALEMPELMTDKIVDAIHEGIAAVASLAGNDKTD